MTAQILDLRIDQGANFEHVFDIEINDSSGNPINLTGFTGELQVRSEAGDDTILADATVDIDITDRTATAVLTSAETEIMEWSCGVYDLVILNGSDVYRLFQGDITLSKQVTVIGV